MDKDAVVTPAMREIHKHLPEHFADLMKLYIENKNFDDRAKIRVNMKIALDIASVDTVYPAEIPKKPVNIALNDYVVAQDQAQGNNRLEMRNGAHAANVDVGPDIQQGGAL